MPTKQVSPVEYTRIMRQICGKKIWRVIHPSDAILFIDAGDWVWGEIYGLRGKTIPHKIGEYRLLIWGDWQYLKANAVIEHSELQPNDTRRSFLQRLEEFAEAFPHQEVLSVEVDGSGTALTLSFDQDAVLRVWRKGDLWVHMINHDFDASHQIVGGHGIRPALSGDALEYIVTP